jgi:transglutaminase superfamily protein
MHHATPIIAGHEKLEPSMDRGLLIYTERGQIVPEMCEEVTTHRRARKVLHVPPGRDPAASTLYLYARRYPQHSGALYVCINGREFHCIPKELRSHFHWIELGLAPGTVRMGANVIDIWADASSQAAWSLGIESGHSDPQSFLSTDRGATWQNWRMGKFHVERGEYLVRLRVTGSHDDVRPPEFQWEDPCQTRVEEMRSVVPPDIRACDDTWERARRLASWVSRQWLYCSEGQQYAPWDPFTILAEPDHSPAGIYAPIRICPHYSVVFTSACVACGIAARPVITTSNANTLSGHFLCEVWIERIRQWCAIDPNLDLAFISGTRPLGAEELFEHRTTLSKIMDVGPGAQFHRDRLGTFFDQYLNGAPMMRLTGVWPRNDFLAHPEFAPPCHGLHTYTETEIVWRDLNRQPNELGVFPHIVEDSYFRTAPPVEF